MKGSTGALFLLIILFLSSCSSNEIGSVRDVNPETIYFDYKVSGEEGNDQVTILLQYRFGGSNGTTLVLDEPSKVELDGELITGDSSRMTGAYYEIRKPVGEFSGPHNIVFTDINKKQYKETFDFQPIALHTEIPGAVKRGDLVFELDGLKPVDYVRVLLTDTSFASEGINRVDTVRNGRILISVADLETLVDGPVELALYKENEKPVKSSTGEGGQFSISYGLKREFVLTGGH